MSLIRDTHSKEIQFLFEYILALGNYLNGKSARLVTYKRFFVLFLVSTNLQTNRSCHCQYGDQSRHLFLYMGLVRFDPRYTRMHTPFVSGGAYGFCLISLGKVKDAKSQAQSSFTLIDFIATEFHSVSYVFSDR